MLSATIIRADGSKPEVRPLDKRMTLKEKQAAVGGLIQLVPAFERYGGKPAVVFANEEGLLEGLPLNLGATYAWRAALTDAYGADGWDRGMAVLVGDVLILTADDAAELADA